jgi:hypothetical protein
MQQADPIRFYRYMNVDVFVYKLMCWFTNGARFSTDQENCDTFQYYPEVAMLTASNVMRIDAWSLDEHTADGFIQA